MNQPPEVAERHLRFSVVIGDLCLEHTAAQ
jgi:hypothetical protein